MASYKSGALNIQQRNLVNAISGQEHMSPALAAAMFVGAQGESIQGILPPGSGGGGLFGFTPPYSDPYYETAPYSQQVKYELPKYMQAAQGTGNPGKVETSALGVSGVPKSLTGAAKAEFIAIAAERPLNDTAELKQIAATNKPTIYGASPGAQVQNWSAPAGGYNQSILQEVAAFTTQTRLQASSSTTGQKGKLSPTGTQKVSVIQKKK